MSENKPLPEFLERRQAVGSVGNLGDIFLCRLRLGVMKDINSSDPDGNIPAEEYVNILILALAEKSDGTKLTSKEIAEIDPESRKRIIVGLIALHSEFYRDDGFPENVDGSKGVVRKSDEMDEFYLARGYRVGMENFGASFRKSVELVSSKMLRSSDHLKQLLSPGLIDNSDASARLSDIIKQMTQSSIGGFKNTDTGASLNHRSYDYEMIKIPPNPIVETNEILNRVAIQISQMRNLASVTAEMQRSLNDTASTALIEFSEGAEKSALAAKRGLIIAVISAILSLIAIIVAIVPFYDSGRKENIEQKQIKLMVKSQEDISKLLIQLRNDKSPNKSILNQTSNKSLSETVPTMLDKNAKPSAKPNAKR
jgi:hypothetical protein